MNQKTKDEVEANGKGVRSVIEVNVDVSILHTGKYF